MNETKLAIAGVVLVGAVMGFAFMHDCTKWRDRFDNVVEERESFCERSRQLVITHKARLGTKYATKPLPVEELNFIFSDCYKNDALWFNQTLEEAMMYDLNGETENAAKALDEISKKIASQ